MNKASISLDLINESSCNDLSIALYINDRCFFNQPVATGTHSITEFIDNSPGTHIFKIVLSNKTHNHTQLNDQNNIISDVLITVTNVKFDDINIDKILLNDAVYTHNHNGHSDTVDNKFYGPMGCNGEVVLDFSTPIHLWLLEKL